MLIAVCHFSILLKPVCSLCWNHSAWLALVILVLIWILRQIYSEINQILTSCIYWCLWVLFLAFTAVIFSFLIFKTFSLGLIRCIACIARWIGILCLILPFASLSVLKWILIVVDLIMMQWMLCYPLILIWIGLPLFDALDGWIYWLKLIWLPINRSMDRIVDGGGETSSILSTELGWVILAAVVWFGQGLQGIHSTSLSSWIQRINRLSWLRLMLLRLIILNSIVGEAWGWSSTTFTGAGNSVHHNWLITLTSLVLQLPWINTHLLEAIYLSS